MFQGMADNKKKFSEQTRTDRTEIEDWLSSPVGGYVMGCAVLALGIWAVIGWIF